MGWFTLVTWVRWLILTSYFFGWGGRNVTLFPYSKLFIVKGKQAMENTYNTQHKWSDLTIKDKLSYIVAFALIASGIIIAFLSFFLNAYNIATGVLLYIGQAFVIGGGLVGASVYFRSKWLEFNTNAKREIDQRIDELSKRIE